MTKQFFKPKKNRVKVAPFYFLGTFLLACLGSLWLSYETLGYLFERPAVLDAAKTIVKVDRLIPVKTSDCNRPKQCKFIVDTSQTIAAHYDPQPHREEERLLLYLQAMGKLPSSFDHNLQGIADLHTPLMQSPIIATPSPGFSNEYLSGVILMGETASGEKRAFLSVSGSQIAEDYYPYYEAMFKIEPSSQTVQYLDGQRFFSLDFDETVLPIVYFILLIVVFGIVSAIILAISKGIQYWRRSTTS